jgi:hypothetical protein
VRRQQRHQPYPEYSPENHDKPFCFSTRAAWRRIHSGALSSFFKFVTNWRFPIPGKTLHGRISFASIQIPHVIESVVIKILNPGALQNAAFAGRIAR